jgi:hypothetical protein
LHENVLKGVGGSRLPLSTEFHSNLENVLTKWEGGISLTVLKIFAASKAFVVKRTRTVQKRINS